MNDAPPAPRSIRRWFRFSLRTLLIVGPLLTIAATYGLRECYLSYRLAWATKQIETAGGKLVRDTEQQVVEVDLPGKKIDDAQLGKLVPALEALPKLRILVLASNQITDAGLNHLDRLPNLRKIHLADTKVTEVGIAKLKAGHPALEVDLTTPHIKAMKLAKRAIYQHAVVALAQLPDGRLLGGSGDGRVQVWNIARQRHIDDFQAHRDWTFSIVRHPSKNWFATGGGDGLIKLWDGATGELRGRFVGHEDDIHGLAFTPDGSKLVSTSDDRTVRIWDVQSRKELFCLEGHEGTIPGVAVSPDGKLAATASRDKTIRLWSIATGKAAGVLEGHTQDVFSVAFHPDGKKLASASYDGSVIEWQLADRRPSRMFPGHQGWAFGVRYSPDGRWLASTAGDGVRLWDIQTAQLVWHDNLQPNVASILWLDSQRLATSSAEGSVLVRNLRGGIEATLWTRFYDPERSSEQLAEVAR